MPEKLTRIKISERIKKLTKKQIILLIAGVAVVVIALAVGIAVHNRKAKEAAFGGTTEVRVERQSIVSSVSGATTVMPKDQYSITALVSGDVLSANFEVGDVVMEGDVLYTIDSSDVENSIRSADLSVERSSNNYQNALEAQDDLTVKSDISGTVKTVYIKKGDSVSAGAKIADVYDDSVMLLTVPFNSTDASNVFVGEAAEVCVSGTSDTARGVVQEVKGASYAKDGNMLVRDVVIRVDNPGTIMPTDSATARVGEIHCNDAGNFEYSTEKTIVSKVSGEVEILYVSKGSKVTKGGTVAVLTSDTVTDNVKNNALSLQESKLSRDNAQKKLEDYTITAPISGTVIEKNVKAGDKLDNGTASSVMAVIYDMSALECELAVDELDIKNVEIGQSVTVTSDALEGKIYHGEVTNISVNGTMEGGVTTYPVTISILDFDEELLPGMNVDAEIITARTDNVLAVPVSAVNRGNIVYVKGEKTEENDRAPEGYKSVVVETGVYNDTLIEIISGLSEGDLVWVPQAQGSGNNGIAAMMGMAGAGGGRMPGGMQGGGMQGGGMPANRGGMSGGMR